MTQSYILKSRTIGNKMKSPIFMSWSKFWEMVKDWDAWHAAVHGVTKSQIQLSDGKTTAVFRVHSTSEQWLGGGGITLYI